MQDERKALVCMLIASLPDGPKVESYVDTCEGCGRAIWHAFSSPQVDVVWCASCAFAEHSK